MLTDGTVCNVDSSISANSKMYLCANLPHVSAGCHHITHTLLQLATLLAAQTLFSWSQVRAVLGPLKGKVASARLKTLCQTALYQGDVVQDQEDGTQKAE